MVNENCQTVQTIERTVWIKVMLCNLKVVWNRCFVLSITTQSMSVC